MQTRAGQFVAACEERKFTRRQMLSCLAVTGASAVAVLKTSAAAQRRASVLRARAINHVSISVSDLKRSAAFYQHMFGLSALRTLSDQTYALDFNGRFIRLSPQPKGGTITQFCIGVDGFRPGRDAAAVRAAGFEVVGTSDEHIDVRDPDAMIVRIAETKYTAACTNCPSPPAGSRPAAEPTLFRARTLNHVNFRVSNLQRSAAFYQKLFGLPLTLRPILPPGSKIYALDFNESYLSVAEATDRDRAGAVTHFCFGVDDFQLKRDGEKLRSSGLTVRGLTGAQGAAQETVYVDDPDGLNVQIADIKWKSNCPTCDPAPPVI